MPYIGKPQSSDPITVNASNIEDGSIIAADISSSLGVAISGSFTTVSSSLGSRVTLVEGGTTSKTLVSGSAQLADDISGSLGDNADVIRSLDRTTISGSSTAISSSLASRVTVNEGRVNQGVKTTDSPTFAGGTVTGDFAVGGTLTAQEVHTEFESASILFTSGSTIFGNSSDDVHNMTGSLNVSGAINLNDGDLIVTDNIGVGTASPDQQLHLYSTSANSPNILIQNENDSAGEAGAAGGIEFYLKDDNGSNPDFQDLGIIRWTGHDKDNPYNKFTAAAISGSADDPGNSSGRIDLNVAYSDSMIDAMTIRAAAAGKSRVGIGSTAPAGTIDVFGDDGYAYFTTTSPAAFNMIFRSGSADPQNNWLGQIEFTGTSGATSQIVTRNSTALALGTNNSQKVTIGTDGNTAFAGQVKLKEGAYNNLSLAFTDDTDTGLYLGGTNALGFVTNGAVALELQGTQLADFRGDLQIPEYIKHSGDTDTSIRFTDNTINFIAGGNTCMQHINGGGVITHGATRATLTAGKSYGSGANVITFTVTVANVSSWEPINFLVEASYTLANLAGTGYYYGWGHTQHYSASGLAGTSTGNGGAQSNITVAVGNYSSNSFDITVTSDATSGTINMIASLDIRARHGISNIVAA